MAATGVVLAFETQIVNYVDRDMRSVSAPGEAQPRPINELLESVRRSDVLEPTAVTLRNHSQAATEFLLGRGRTIFVDPYSGAVLGSSSGAAHSFFFAVEKLHRALGAPLGSKSTGHWLAATSNLLFGILIVLGIVLWAPRKWSRKAMRASMLFRTGLRGRARDWSWHNVLGIWCALPLLVIALTGVVMSYNWANALLFRLSGSAMHAQNRRGNEPRGDHRDQLAVIENEPNYERLFMIAKTLNPDWRTITLNMVQDSNSPVAAVIDTGAGGQPQKRTQYLLNRETGVVIKVTSFGDGSLGQRLRAFVRFGHTGEYYGWAGQAIAALASLGACVLVYTGLALSIRRLAATLKHSNRSFATSERMGDRETAIT